MRTAAPALLGIIKILACSREFYRLEIKNIQQNFALEIVQSNASRESITDSYIARFESLPGEIYTFSRVNRASRRHILIYAADTEGIGRRITIINSIRAECCDFKQNTV